MLTSPVRRAAPTLAALSALMLPIPAGAAQAKAPAKATKPPAVTVLKATLTGAAEKPTPGDPKGSGTVTLRVDPAQEQVCYELRVKGLAKPTMAHIHEAPPTDSGPPLADLKPPGPDGKSSGCVSAGPILLQGLTDNPTAYYVNVHNDQYKAGAVRGQLSR